MLEASGGKYFAVSRLPEYLENLSLNASLSLASLENGGKMVGDCEEGKI